MLMVMWWTMPGATVWMAVLELVSIFHYNFYHDDDDDWARGANADQVVKDY